MTASFLPNIVPGDEVCNAFCAQEVPSICPYCPDNQMPPLRQREDRWQAVTDITENLELFGAWKVSKECVTLGWSTRSRFAHRN